MNQHFFCDAKIRPRSSELIIIFVTQKCLHKKPQDPTKCRIFSWYENSSMFQWIHNFFCDTKIITWSDELTIFLWCKNKFIIQWAKDFLWRRNNHQDPTNHYLFCLWCKDRFMIQWISAFFCDAKIIIIIQWTSSPFCYTK